MEAQDFKEIDSCLQSWVGHTVSVDGSGAGVIKAVTSDGELNWYLFVQPFNEKEEIELRFPFDFLSRKFWLKDLEFQRQGHKILSRLLGSEEPKRKYYADCPQFGSVRQFEKYFSNQLERAIYQSSLQKSSRHKILFGIRENIEETPDGTVYEYLFQSEHELHFPENTAVTIFQNKAEYNGIILECHNQEVRLQTQNDFGDEVESLEIGGEMMWLSLKTASEFYFACSSPNPIVQQLILGGKAHIQNPGIPIKTGVQEALESARQNQISCIWGPPGTGKTTTLAKMIRQSIQEDKRILVTAFSNAALDQALEKLVTVYPDLLPGNVIRFGNPVYPSLADHPWLPFKNYLRLIYPNFYRLLDAIGKARKQIQEFFKNERTNRNPSSETSKDQKLTRTASVKLFSAESPLIQALQDLEICLLECEGSEEIPFCSSLKTQLTDIFQVLSKLKLAENSGKSDPKRASQTNSQTALPFSIDLSMSLLKSWLKALGGVDYSMQIREKELKKECIEKVKVIFATSSMLISSDLLSNQTFETVFFDEISMSTIHQAVIAANKAEKHLIFLGDFNQLPPVTNARLQVDVFRYLGIYDALKKERGHDWLVMLDTQYRMNSEIGHFISRNFYFDLLKTPVDIDLKLDPIIQRPPFAGSKIVLVDCSEFLAGCKVLPSFSRVNILSALIAANLALIAASTGSVAVISPYSIQSLLIQNIFNDLRIARVRNDKNPSASSLSPDLQHTNTSGKPGNQPNGYSGSLSDPQAIPGFHSIKASTVHQFQGSESDVVILDLTDNYGANYVSGLLSSQTNDLANRLFNVSLSRAKGKLIVLAGRRFFSEKLNPTRIKASDEHATPLLLNRFFLWMDQEIENMAVRSVSGQQLETEMKKLKSLDSLLISGKENTGLPFFQCLENFNSSWKQYLENLRQAKNEIRIDLPDKPTPDQNMALRQLKMVLDKKSKQVAQNAEGKPVRIVIRTRKVSLLPAFLQSYALETSSPLDPITIIDRKLSWYGMPRCINAFHFKNRVIPVSRNPVFRIDGAFTSVRLAGFLSMKDKDALRIPGLKEDFDAYLKAHESCPSCYSPMQSVIYQGKAFLGCTNYPECKTGSASISRDLVAGYLTSRKQNPILCPDCSSPMDLAGSDIKNKAPLLICSSDSSHNCLFTDLL